MVHGSFNRFTKRASANFRPAWVLAISSAFSVFGCDRPSAPSDSSNSVSITRAASTYRSINGSEPIAVANAAAQAKLDAASVEARKTMIEACKRWRRAGEADRTRWMVKWAAPIEEDGATTQPDAPIAAVEHVWVLPVQWSEFRIEGVLVSQPVRELSCGKRAGDFVGFPAEELSDWLCQPGTGSSAKREGGFTIKALESSK
jgi:uncharacterized protein YegJ (DUF2314 family)